MVHPANQQLSAYEIEYMRKEHFSGEWSFAVVEAMDAAAWSHAGAARYGARRHARKNLIR